MNCPWIVLFYSHCWIFKVDTDVTVIFLPCLHGCKPVYKPTEDNSKELPPFIKTKPKLGLQYSGLPYQDHKSLCPLKLLNCLFHSLLDANNANSQNKMFVPPTHAYTKLPCWPPCMIHSSVFIRVEGRLKSQRMIVIGPLMPYFSCREHIPKPAQGCVQTFLITSL